VRTSTVVIGAGHAGLAMSQRLTARGVDHVVLDRGRVGESWRTKRWPGLRLLTPNWMLGLPGQAAGQPDPDGFLTAPEVADLVGAYACRVSAPVRTHTTVQSVRRARNGYEISTDAGALRADSVVLATGASAVPAVPACAAGLSDAVAQRTAVDYRGPESLPDGGVLVVGASATGVQIAAELRAAGRPVTLAVGEHVRLPRRYRGHDVFWWLHMTGVLAERHDEVDDLARARRLPSPQLVGSSVPVDLGSLVSSGVRLVGRLSRIDDDVAQFSGSLRNVCELADLKMDRFLRRADAWAAASGKDELMPPTEVLDRTPIPSRPTLSLDLVAHDIRTVVWATGFRPDHACLDLPVFDRKGRIRHRGGVVTDAPGLYVLGLPMLRTRASTYIYGASADTASLADNLVANLPS
jgi:putative flavoprotein involved in K+ transport